jgi:hypothetical protein
MKVKNLINGRHEVNRQLRIDVRKIGACNFLLTQRPTLVYSDNNFSYYHQYQ